MSSFFSSIRNQVRYFVTSSNVSSENAQKVKDTVESIITTTPVAVFSKSWCPYCLDAKQTLAKLVPESKMKVLELNQEEFGSAMQAQLAERVGASKVTVPQIYINGKLIGGNSDLQQLKSSGKLDALLSAAQ
ncbi:glutaredoxin [Rhodotorula paludigena]|uniref:glutaredoxin n=1 Tax=Rhodotorula paludigena TaxID=86838 RepID=UPI003172696A